MPKIIELDNGKEIKKIEVPLLAFGFDVNNYADESELMYMMPIESLTSEYGDETLKTIKLPQGGWRIIRK